MLDSYGRSKEGDQSNQFFSVSDIDFSMYAAYAAWPQGTAGGECAVAQLLASVMRGREATPLELGEG
jgi:hypothetical protein